MNVAASPIKVGISSCLLGQEVRYDGGHKLSTLCTRELARFFELVPTCPEAGAGLGVPRPPIRLIGDPAAPRAVQVEDASVDVTESLNRYAAERIPHLQDLSGYIFIRNSPSCGLFQVKVYQDSGNSHRSDSHGANSYGEKTHKGNAHGANIHGENIHSEEGRGIFAAALTRAMPLLPVEEDGRLRDQALRENFITRVFAWHDWQQLLARELGRGLSVAAVIDFHARYKYTLMAHSPQAYQVLGRMLADAGRHDPTVLGVRYITALMQALQKKTTPGTNSNVLMHLQGYLKKHLQPQEKQHLAAVIEQYRKGLAPLAVPIALLRHYFHQHPDPYIERQAFLQSCAADSSSCNTP